MIIALGVRTKQSLIELDWNSLKTGLLPYSRHLLNMFIYSFTQALN